MPDRIAAPPLIAHLHLHHVLGGLELDERLDAGKALLAGLHDRSRWELLPHDAAHLKKKEKKKQQEEKPRIKKKQAGIARDLRVWWCRPTSGIGDLRFARLMVDDSLGNPSEE